MAEHSPPETGRRSLRAVALAVVKLLPITIAFLVLAPLQWLSNRFAPQVAARLPMLFHRVALWTLRVRVRKEGEHVGGNNPALLVGNHVSWLDIVILGACGPVRFISKDDVAHWPVFGTLARLQRTVFIDRNRRQSTALAITARDAALSAGDKLVLFAEGTSSDGNQVLPFKSALLPATRGERKPQLIQPFVLAYLRRDGLRLSRAERARLGWYGDMDLLPSLLDRLTSGPLEVALIGLPSFSPEPGLSRKALAHSLQSSVQATLASRLRHP
ncbi:MAG: lysophospholipid acyltransferase family protein [Pseudomonadota bacterium]